MSNTLLKLMEIEKQLRHEEGEISLGFHQIPDRLSLMRELGFLSVSGRYLPILDIIEKATKSQELSGHPIHTEIALESVACDLSLIAAELDNQG